MFAKIREIWTIIEKAFSAYDFGFKKSGVTQTASVSLLISMQKIIG